MTNLNHNLNKSDLAIHLARKFPSLDDDLIKESLDIIFYEITHSIALGERIEIRGFGVFSKKYIRPRRFVNPKTKKESFLGETATMHFKESSKLIDSNE